MSTVEQFDQLLQLAQQLGYRIRYDYFGGTGGGLCEYSAGKWLFIDLALSIPERLEYLQTALAKEPLLSTLELSNRATEALGIRKDAA